MSRRLLKKREIGLYTLILGIFIMLKTFFPNLKLLFFFLMFLAVLSLHITIQIMLTKKRKRMLVLSISVLLSSIFFVTYILWFKNSVSLKSIWPILGFFPGIGLVVYYFFSTSKNSSTIIPALFIILLSVIMLLLSNDFIQIDFTTILMLLISLMLILAGLLLVFRKNIEKIKNEIEGLNNSKKK